MYTMKQAADRMNISVHTLRFYANEGLFPNITRDYNNNRRFSEADLEWIKLVQCLRETSMPISEIRQYIELFKEGEGTMAARLDMIERQKERAEAELEEMQKRIELLNWKTDLYRSRLEGRDPHPENPFPQRPESSSEREHIEEDAAGRGPLCSCERLRN
jgi:DNA-binding transcriptional MerR regulator